MDKEQWKPIEEYGGKYEVSNLEGKIFYNIKEVSGYYGINYSTLCCWLNGTNPMPEEWKKKGLGHYGE